MCVCLREGVNELDAETNEELAKVFLCVTYSFYTHTEVIGRMNFFSSSMG